MANTFIVNSVESLYRLLIHIGNSLQSTLLLLIRLCWGIQFAMTGFGKLSDISKPTDFFTQLGIPFPEANAYLVGCTEMIGGTLLALGLISRLAAIPLIITLLVAYLTSEQEALHKLFTFSDVDPFLTAAPFLFMFAALIVLIFGPGRYSLDRLLERTWRKELVA